MFENLGLTTNERKDQAQVIAALKHYVDGCVNETIEKTQPSSSTSTVLLVSLRELAKTCNFCISDYLKKAIRDQIIEGLFDGDTIKELL